MKASTTVVAANAAVNLAKQRQIIKFAKTHPEKQAELAVKEYKRFNLITLLIIFCIMIPLCIYSFFSIDKEINHPQYPDGATQEVSGHVSLYKDTFWYTDSSQKYEFEFDEYNVDDSFEPGEHIRIYLDDKNQVIAIAHKDSGFGIVIRVILMFVIPIILLLTHAFLGRKTYARNYNLYTQWYEMEIAPYQSRENFEALVKDKRYYDVTVSVEHMSEENRKLYKKYRRKGRIYAFLFLLCIIMTIYFTIVWELNPYSWLVIGVIVVYVSVFYILINHCDGKMKRIRDDERKNIR